MNKRTLPGCQTNWPKSKQTEGWSKRILPRFYKSLFHNRFNRMNITERPKWIMSKILIDWHDIRFILTLTDFTGGSTEAYPAQKYGLLAAFSFCSIPTWKLRSIFDVLAMSNKVLPIWTTPLHQVNGLKPHSSAENCYLDVPL